MIREVLPGVHHWSARHPGIGQTVHSLYLEPGGVLVDPLMPDEGPEWFARRDAAPTQVVMTIHHHWRDCPRLAEALGVPIRLCAPGVQRLEAGRSAEPFAFGEELAPGVTALEVGAIAPDETALHVAAGDGALVFGDALLPHGGELGFMPDGLLGDDPEGVKAGLRAAFRRLLERDFDTLLFAHGEPVVGGGRARLEAFAG